MLTGASILSRVRKYTNDYVEPYILPDDLLLAFINEAEREMALNGRILRRVVTLTAAINSDTVALPEEMEVIEFRKAFLIDENRRSSLRLQGTMDEPPCSKSVGKPTTLFFGRNYNEVFLSPIPDKRYDIEASLIVYPEEEITIRSYPSIPARHHQALAIGGALLALEADFTIAENNRKRSTLEAAWQQALIRAAQETGAISREAAPVQFSNEYW
jgi:hypothetical protein